MSRFTLDLSRVNFTIERRGKEYELRLQKRSQTILNALMSLLPSNYVSSIVGPNYTVELKAIAVEMARLELAIEDVDLDRDFNKTRSEFMYPFIGYMVFLNNRLPPLEYSDEEFRKFLLSLLGIYFQGSIPSAIEEAAGLFISQDFQVFENFLLTRAGAAGYDISDQFGFQINIEVTGDMPPDIFELTSSIRIVLDIIRPAHTLFRIRFVFRDTYIPTDPSGNIVDAYRWRLRDYRYEDFRSYWQGIRDKDRLGQKTNIPVVLEDHSGDF